jgi:curved DNA-binding protein
LSVSLEDAYRGGKKSITLTITESVADGSTRKRAKTLEVNLPAGITDGKRLRLGGQGGQAADGGRAGDLYITVRIAPHPRFRVNGRDLETDVAVTPWEAALGASIKVPLVIGKAEIRIPPGIQSGKRIRVKGKGLGGRNEPKGDIYAVIKIVVPERLSDDERKLFEQLARKSTFTPRER